MAMVLVLLFTLTSAFAELGEWKDIAATSRDAKMCVHLLNAKMQPCKDSLRAIENTQKNIIDILKMDQAAARTSYKAGSAELIKDADRHKVEIDGAQKACLLGATHSKGAQEKCESFCSFFDQSAEIKDVLRKRCHGDLAHKLEVLEARLKTWSQEIKSFEAISNAVSTPDPEAQPLPPLPLPTVGAPVVAEVASKMPGTPPTGSRQPKPPKPPLNLVNLTGKAAQGAAIKLKPTKRNAPN